MEKYTDDQVVLDLIEWHDDAYYCWLHQHRNPTSDKLHLLLDKIGDCLQIYYLFFKCDTQTGDKTQAPIRWFERKVPGIIPVVIKPYWPWEKV
jgi:hypothetical protein